MPKDADIGRELATQLKSLYLGKIREIEFTYDTKFELDDLPDEPYVRISPETAPFERASRGTALQNCVLRMTLISKRAPEDPEAFIDEILDGWDTMMKKLFEELVPLGNRLVSAEPDDRYDSELFNSHARLVMSTTLNYSVI